MASQLMQDPKSGLMLPRQFVDEKQSLKKVIDEILDNSVLANQNIKQTYYLSLHAKFDKHDSSKFMISQPVITYKLPPFVSNQMVFWVNNQKGICELLWMTSKKNGKLAVDFNQTGVAYLQAKGAMPS
jgi:hypothetical protein